ncbi:hypothetical protein [Allorhizobium sonneratiae]|uniref:hypothetical protein n=1 Tax=Allorhizobium sonneratiae TaxID=2934936 RepID=UPI0020332814|nr:hypothetical protein [Allorhizobium sonneratiae]
MDDSASAEYISEISRSLAQLALRSGYPFLMYLLVLAADEDTYCYAMEQKC